MERSRGRRSFGPGGSCPWRGLVSATAIVILASIDAGAQVSTGGIRGVVTDATSGVLVGVTIEASSPARISGAAVGVTNAQGMYHFQNLPVGDYVVVFSLQGFSTVQRENIRVEVGRTIQLDATMSVGAQEQVVTVTGETPVLDTTNAAFTSNFNVQLLDKIPAASRAGTGGYFDVITFAPAVSLNRGLNSSQFIIHGSNSDQNSFQYDGIDVSSLSAGSAGNFPNFDLMQEVQVRAVGASAEFAGVQGGVVNVVTKSGSNAWRGGVSVFYADEHLTGNNTPAEQFPLYVDYDRAISMDIGGPLVRNRLWITGVNYIKRLRSSQVGVDPQLAPSLGVDRPFAKATWRITTADTVDFSYTDNILNVPDPTSRTNPRETVNNFKGFGPVLLAHWTRTLGSATLLEVKGGDVLSRIRINPYKDNYDTARHQDLGTGMVSGNIAQVVGGQQDELKINATLAHTTVRAGSHDVKVGVQGSSGTAATYNAFVKGALYLDMLGQPFLAIFREPAATGGRIRTIGAFVQDTWSVNNRATLNLGVRTDFAWADVPAMQARDDQARTPTGVTYPALPNLLNFHTVSPRVGATIRLGESQTVAKVWYGRYYGKLTTGMFSAASPGNPPTSTYRYNPATRQYDILISRVTSNANFGVDHNATNQYTDQFSVGIERQLMADFGVDIFFIHKKEHNFLRMKDVRGTYQLTPVVDTFRGNTEVIQVYNQTNSPSASLFEVTNRDDLKQDYNAVVVQGNKRFSQHWQAQASYVWSRAQANGGGSIGQTSQSYGSLTPSSFGADPNDLINSYGPTPTDSTHNVRLTGTYAALYNISVALRYSYESGHPYARLITIPLLNQGTRTVKAEPRGSYHLPAVNNCELNVEKAFKVGGSRQLRLTLDLFNVFNSGTAVDVRNNSTETGDSNFGQSLTVVTPRQARIGVRFAF